MTVKVAARVEPMDISKPIISLNGDEFKNDTEYFKQIPGYWESIVEASKEPLEGLANAKELGWEVLAGLGNYVSGAAGASFSPTCGGGAGLH